MKTKRYIKRLINGWIPNITNLFIFDQDKNKFITNDKELYDAILIVYEKVIDYLLIQPSFEPKTKEYIIINMFNKYSNKKYSKIIKDILNIDIKIINYDMKPIRERKDNQNPSTNTLNYGSGYNGYYNSSIRVPSKKHKNKYKNFLKLFPNINKK